MAYHFDFDPIHRIARFRLEGHFSDEHLREYYAAATRFAALTNPAGGLFDASGVTSFAVSSGTVYQLASLPPNISDQSVPRVVIAPSPEMYGMARMFEMFGERTRQICMSSTPNARHWPFLAWSIHTLSLFRSKASD